MIATTLVYGATSVQRDAAIHACVASLPANARIGLILEGPASSADRLGALAAGDTRLILHRIAAGCPCCSGNLTLRVTLDRLIHRAPNHILLGIASDAHQAQLRDFLMAAPYDRHLALMPDLRAPACAG